MSTAQPTPSVSNAVAVDNKAATLYRPESPAVKTHLALLLLSIAPLVVTIPTNLNIILTASLAIYAGSWRSVKATPPQETMTKKDAMRFPIVGSCVLFGLFLLFKFVPKWLVNALLSLYIGSIAVFVLTAALAPYLTELVPGKYRHTNFVFPKFNIPYLVDNSDQSIRPSIAEIVSLGVSTGFCVWYYTKKHWFANNSLGLAFCLTGIEHLSLGSVHVGIILLSGLFFYDIFWVFCTPVMVSVAKNFDAPIKLLFPRAGVLDSGARPFAMLGLGDIVIPGFFVALMLRYDVSRNYKSKYFQSAFFGYVLGLSTTIFVMNYFQAAQPALLYIVPGVLGSLGIHAAVKKEFKSVFNWSEAKEGVDAAVTGTAVTGMEEKKTL